ncbi:Npun_F0494 family protein [Almyronema epifaneia]|uniref:Npun_F0494 family protein n=1 Tax=Almyronema epifaneia S1 TaxID=2991925 RepID=A0ABW6IJK5_9CYAN
MDTNSSQVSAIEYPLATLERANRAVQCSPFRLKLLADMRSQSVSIKAIADDRGISNGYTLRPLAELIAEDELLWLIQVGLLRREVDGQGLTDSFRLTPLGRQLVERWAATGFPDRRPSLRDQLYNALNRWLRLPNWLQ